MQHNITIIVVEQKMQLLSEFCSRLVIMDKGRIVLDDSVRNILSKQDTLCRLGVDSPPVARLAYMMKQEGLYDGEFPINLEEVFNIVKCVLKLRHVAID